MRYGKETARFRAESATDGPRRKLDPPGGRIVGEGGGPGYVHVCTCVLICACVHTCVPVCELTCVPAYVTIL